VPVIRPLESRYSERAPPPPLGRLVAVPMIRPEASRVTACPVLPAPARRSMVWTTRPEASRTTSRQVWAASMDPKVTEITIPAKIVFTVS
jgi:hypothetical protein